MSALCSLKTQLPSIKTFEEHLNGKSFLLFLVGFGIGFRDKIFLCKPGVLELTM